MVETEHLEARFFKVSSEPTDTSTSTGVSPQRTGDPIEAVPSDSEPTEETRQGEQKRTVQIMGSIPPEVWNRIGTKLIPKLRSGANLRVGVEFVVELDSKDAAHFLQELKEALAARSRHSWNFERTLAQLSGYSRDRLLGCRGPRHGHLFQHRHRSRNSVDK